MQKLDKTLSAKAGPTGNRKNKVLKNKNFVCIDFMHVMCVSGTQNSDVFFKKIW